MTAIPALAHEYTEFSGKVVGVINGDTIQLMHEGQVLNVRLAGIDCPEDKQPFGEKAKQFTSGLVLGYEVTIKVWTKDKNGQILADVILSDGRNLNQELLKTGLAWRYRSYNPDSMLLKTLETEARIARRGLWTDKNPTAPWEWRKKGR
jgi:endonuclease YncB( thermonuclease family)